MKITLICTICNKIDYGDGTWSNLNEKSPKDLATALCPDCCYERFPQFYSDYEDPKERFRKKFSSLLSLKSKR
jgi:hypothetical protein